jgi:hypothetical protein
MKFSLTALWLGVVSVIVCPAQFHDAEAGQPFAISISASNLRVKTDQPAEIKIRLTNTSNHPIDVSEVGTHGCSMDQSYKYDIRDASGRVSEILPEIKARTKSEGRVTATVKVHTLNPGETQEATIDVSRCYDMTAPGEYSIELSREIPDDPKHAALKSNRITVTVAPADSQ